MIPIDWDNILLTIQLEIETHDLELDTEKLLKEVTEYYETYQNSNTCIECGAWACIKHYGNNYCVNCYEEMQFQE